MKIHLCKLSLTYHKTLNMRISLALVFFLFISVVAQAQSESNMVETVTIQLRTIVDTSKGNKASLINKRNMVGLYRLRNSRVKKALTFRTLGKKVKLA